MAVVSRWLRNEQCRSTFYVTKTLLIVLSLHLHTLSIYTILYTYTLHNYINNSIMSVSQASVANSSTALVTGDRNEFEFDLMESLDAFRWHLIDVEMKDDDRRAVEGFLEGLMQEVEKMTATKKTNKKKRSKRIVEAARKKMRKWLVKLYKKYCYHAKSEPIQSSPQDPIRPFDIYTPAKKRQPDEMEVTPNDSEDIYYLRSDCDAYSPKTPSFFERSGNDTEPTHKRVPTLETLRMDSAADPDLYDDLHEDSFFHLVTGI